MKGEEVWSWELGEFVTDVAAKIFLLEADLGLFRLCQGYCRCDRVAVGRNGQYPTALRFKFAVLMRRTHMK